ncbi:MAG: flavin-dependent monooxygenase [Curvibacter lanceolatus]|uniref:acyl-CoA dehydrogenase family protein n=1 Tax=Curvibacter lanceolatus TaxID=86182 RepID=UPI0023578FF9|nr:acyl-CoA dehydrogenase family protein [Curvibacter lanceolatus]MBV5296403.1 flavin-dependent monooxygenase [Curvibacter lanceolatus]
MLTLEPERTTPASPPSPDGVAHPSFDGLLTDIRARSAEFAQQRFISPDVVESFKHHGMYRALVPRTLGGEERSPRYFCEKVERIAQADGSAGWVASFGMGITYLASLPIETLRQVYAASPNVVFCAGVFPPQSAPVVEGGFEVSGRWSFASGCMGASLVGVGIAPTGLAGQSLPRLAVMPIAKARIDPTWDVIGLTGTGSHDIVVDKVVVPEEWTFVRGSASTLDAPICRYPSLSFATQVLSVVSLGIARGAIEELKNLATGRTSVTGAPRTADRPQVQMDIARAEATLRAARAFFYDAMDEVWETLLRGDTPTQDQISMLRLSSTHATRAGAEVTRSVQMLAGMTGIYRSCPLSTQVQDSLVVTQHAFMGDITYQNAGAMLFGLKPLPGYL